MSKDIKNDEDTKSQSPVSDRFPGIIIIIALSEFCERFSYSGMKAFLTLYLRSKLGYTDDGATETYHWFSTFIYVFPIVGGIMADNYLGKFKTILYMMFVYAAGNMLVALTAIPQLALPARLCTFIGLFMITIGAGGIKPCVTAFGGDQFRLPEQEHHLAVYFSLLYFSLCMGSLIAKTVSPILRSEIHCFGDKDCYSLAFGAPGLLVLLSIVVFVSAKSRYVMKSPEGNVVLDFVRCVSLGLKNALFKRGKNEKHSHWLDTMHNQYDKRFIRDIKKTLSILMLFTVLPVFWALLDQMGSRWTLQATKMDGRFGLITIKPDQMQVLSPICILILIPLFQKTTYPDLPQPGYSQLRIFNGNPCSVSIENIEYNITLTVPSLSHVTRNIPVHNTSLPLKLGGSCIEPREELFLLEDNRAVSFYFARDVLERYVDNPEKSKAGFPVVRFLIPPNNTTNVVLYNNRRNETEVSVSTGVSSQMEVFVSTYSLVVNGRVVTTGLELLSGGVYTIMVDEDGGRSNLITVTEPNSINMILLLPQFLIMSIAEVLFAITGNEFAFKESPESMKAVMTSVWLLTEAVGNVIIIVITRVFVNYAQEIQFFIYTGLMFFSMIIFYVLSSNYQFGVEEECKKEFRSNSEVLYMQVKQAEDIMEH
ncbi:peptide transporter family 1 isoform X2 [Manduca sexta]|uniref:peptide transporter family 1 isoform X2 n=1 Tax=Manduca sexta TaxID=7130 RepID=UPI00188F5D44|nr:peptide transporter family 1 isoform X2 [Manduca sexta]